MKVCGGDVILAASGLMIITSILVGVVSGAGPPGPPSSVHVTDNSPTTVTLTIEPPESDGGIRVDGYQVEYRGSIKEFDIDEMVTIENLFPGTMYIFRVQSRNTAGLSEAYEHSHRTQSVREPYPIVVNSGPLGTEETEYRLSWEVPSTGGMPITEYEIKYRKVEVDGNTVVQPLGEWSQRRIPDDLNDPYVSYLIENLDSKTVYQLDIRARSELGWSEPNTRFYFATFGAELGSPSRPSSVHITDNSPTTVTLSIEPPVEDQVVPIDDYVVKLYGGYTLQFDIDEIITIENLRPGTMYIFIVQSRNAVGMSEALGTPHRTESIREPYQIVVNSEPLGVESTEYLLTWEVPITGGMPIREYEIKYCKVEVVGDTIVQPLGEWTLIRLQDDPSNPILSFMLANLDPESNYQVEIRARNELGWSEPNADFYFTTADDSSD